MTTHKLVSSDDGDWIGLYAPDGRLLDEGHSLTESRILDALGITYKHTEMPFVDGDRCELTYDAMVTRTAGYAEAKRIHALAEEEARHAARLAEINGTDVTR
jgi:pimeloyl-CoA synthetase